MTLENKKRVIEKYLNDPLYKEFSYSNLSRLIIEQNPNDFFSQQVLRKLVAQVAKEQIPNLEITAEKELVPFLVEGTSYFFNSKRGKFNFTVDFIDQLFYEFSEHGLNLSSTEVMNKHGLEPFQWHHIKFVLNLYKKSNIFSPFTVSNTPSERLGEMIEEKMDKLFSSVQYQVEQKYEKSLLRKYKREIEKSETRNLEVNTIISELVDLIPQCKVTLQYNTQTNTSTGPIVVHIADIHFGAESRNSSLPDYSPEKTKEYLYKIAQEVNRLKSREVHIMFSGDLIENFTGLAHPDSWKGIAKGYYGAKVVIECYKLLGEFISLIHNTKSVYGVSGNHDRASSDKKQESEGYIGQIIFEFLSLSFKDKVEIIYDEKIIAKTIDSICYIMSHGDKSFSFKNPAELILDYGEQRLFNLLVSGHWHERQIKKDTKNFRQIVCPSLFPGNDFSQNLGYSTNPGFIITYNNGKGQPILIDYSL